MGVDERLRRELGSLAPADPSGAYERVVEKRVRRRFIRKAQVGVLAVAVLVGSAVGMFALFRVFGVGQGNVPATPGRGGILFMDEIGGRWDIFLIHEDGSGLTNLTDDPAEQGAPTWSPDASEIAYTGYDPETGLGRLWVMTSDATDRRAITPSMESIDDPTWSPDGEQIAFAGNSSIYVVDAAGGEPRQLTTDGRDGSPAWSPDGTTIVFQRLWEAETGAADLFAIPSDGGEPTQITHLDSAYDPDWSPDGSRIVFTTVRDLAVLEVATGAATVLTQPDPDDAYDRDASWSPNGSRIAFASTRGDGQSMRLYTMNADGSDVRLLLDRPFSFCCPMPDWSPSGESGPIETVSFAASAPPSATEAPGIPNDSTLGSGLGSIAATWYHGFPDPEHDLALVSTDDGLATPLTSGTQIDSQAAWSPDGSTIAFWRVPREGPPGAGIYTVPAMGGEPSLLLETDLSIWSISWSPEGDRIAFVGVTPVDGTQADMPMAVYTMSSDGSDLQQLTSDGQVMDAAWSPDGTRLAITRSYAIGESRTGNDIYVLDLATGEEQRLTHDGTAGKPSWSPDGTRIAFTSNETGEVRDADLYVMNADGSGRTRLTDTLEIEGDTAWAPDGAAIAVTRLALGEPRDCDLVLVAPDGSAERVLVDGPADGSCPISLAWQPGLG